MNNKIFFLIGGFIIGFIISFVVVNNQYQTTTNGSSTSSTNKEDLPPNHPNLEESKDGGGGSKTGKLEAFGGPKSTEPTETATNPDKKADDKKTDDKKVDDKKAASSPKASETYKNIQIMKDIPADQVLKVMQGFTEGLGVNCMYCHVSTDELDKDGKAPKQTAREMLKMVREINKSYPTEGAVTCYTCHRGAIKPAS